MLSLAVLLDASLAQLAPKDEYHYERLLPCTLSSLELSKLGPNDPLEPCILYDEKPVGGTPDYDGVTSLITMVQVSPSSCKEQRDGALVATRKMNQDNGGKGVAVGFYENYYVSLDD